MSTKTIRRLPKILNSLAIWQTSWVCYRSKFTQIAPVLVLGLMIPIALSSILSWHESAVRVQELYKMPTGADLNQMIDWCFNVVGNWARIHFLIYAFLFVLVGLSYTFLCSVFLDYFLCERLATSALLKKSLSVYLRLIFPTLLVSFVVLIFSSPIFPVFLSVLILTAYLEIHAFYFSEFSRNPFRFFFANVFLKFLDRSQVRKLDFFFMSFSTIGIGLVLFYGLESFLIFLKSYELKLPTTKIFMDVSFYAILIDLLEAIGLGFVLSYFGVVTTTAFFQTQNDA